MRSNVTRESFYKNDKWKFRLTSRSQQWIIITLLHYSTMAAIDHFKKQTSHSIENAEKMAADG